MSTNVPLWLTQLFVFQALVFILLISLSSFYTGRKGPKGSFKLLSSLMLIFGTGIFITGFFAIRSWKQFSKSFP